MWIKLLVVGLVILYMIFYILGKNHEKQMSLESFANDMIIDDLAEYPDGIGTKLIDEELIETSLRQQESDTCKWCDESRKKKNNKEDEDEDEESDKSSSKHKHRRRHRDYDDDVEEEECHPEHVGSDYLAEEALKTKENKLAASDFNKYIRYRKMKKLESQLEDAEDKRNWFVEPDPSILSQYGYTYMPNTLWSVPQRRPPVCITDSKCKVQPLFSSDKFTDIMEYTGVGTIMPNFEYKNVPTKEHPDKKKYLQKVSELKRPNPHYFYPGWYGYDEKDESNVDTDL